MADAAEPGLREDGLLAGQHGGDDVDRGLKAGVNRAVRRCDAANNGANVMMLPPSARYFTAACVARRRPSNIDIEVPESAPR